ncbi:glycosyltransferase [Serinicoccus kebangsaanensis]|uniref:glycosyltransferase n=1 Tax=Serinicoccus kebangsaanensis TaxID=2602069 RepID=UPI00192D90AC|nr:glycosyltransferase [Serinicoccus kebangsaanensis]
MPLSQEVGAREIASFADEVHRPLLVVGNGPSSAMPPYRRIPADAVVIRMNWFFLESNYHFGDRVDAWFSAVPNETLERMLQEEIRTGRYDVRRILTPMRLASQRDGEGYGLDPRVQVTELDSWSMPARNPRLARHFMSRPGLPTTGMQALAFGLGVGFREIYLAGLDLYESKDARYGYTIPEVVERGLMAKDLAPGYEAAHGLDTDIAFLRACLAEYPDARVRSVSQSDTLHLYVPPATDLDDRPVLEPAEGSVVGLTKETSEPQVPMVDEQEPITIPAVPGPRWKEIDGRRCAYVTVVSGAYHHGARALANSLRRVSDVPLIALCTPGADKAALAASGILTLDVPPILNPALSPSRRRRQKMQSRFAATYTKLHVFRLDFLDRAVYVDSDAVVRAPIDELFEGDDFAAVPDAGINLPNGRTFNSGVFAFTPSRTLFEQMMGRLSEITSYDGGDQGFLNVFFDRWRALPLEYNTTKRMAAHHPALFHDDDVKILHYVGKKPWEVTGDHDVFDELEYAWLDYLTDAEKNELVRDLRRQEDLSTQIPTGDPAVRAREHLRGGSPATALRVLEQEAATRTLSTGERRLMAMAYVGVGHRRKALRVLERANSPVTAARIGQGIASAYLRSRSRSR